MNPVSAIQFAGSSRRLVSSLLASFLGGVLLFILAINLINDFQGNSLNVFSFESLLNSIASTPAVSMDFLFSSGITADWGILNPLKNFLNLFVSFWNFIAFTGQGFANLFLFISHFLRVLFLS